MSKEDLHKHSWKVCSFCSCCSLIIRHQERLACWMVRHCGHTAMKRQSWGTAWIQFRVTLLPGRSTHRKSTLPVLSLLWNSSRWKKSYCSDRGHSRGWWCRKRIVCQWHRELWGSMGILYFMIVCKIARLDSLSKPFRFYTEKLLNFITCKLHLLKVNWKVIVGLL